MQSARHLRHLLEWNLRGNPVPPPTVVKQRTVKHYQKKFGPQILIGDPAFLALLKPRQCVLLRCWLFRDARAMSKHSDAAREFFRPHDRNPDRRHYAFARCDYLIGPPSTLTMWASFYGKVPLNFILRNDQPMAMRDFQVQK